jgi:2-oxoisovalerate dehydrogenase E2 component (dihydrolipoyl transacylase)
LHWTNGGMEEVARRNNLTKVALIGSMQVVRRLTRPLVAASIRLQQQPVPLSGKVPQRGFRVSNKLYQKKTQEFLLAAVGEGIAEVEIIQYHVKVGDTIQQFDKVLDVQTDKATVEITSRYDGVVKSINYQPGQMAKVGTSLITLETEGSGASTEPEAAAKAETPAKAQKVETTAESSDDENEGFSGKVLTTPAVRRIAKEYQVNLKHVTPSGPGGRILKEDILKFLQISGEQSLSAPPMPEATSKPARAAASSSGFKIPVLPQPSIPSTPKEDKVVPITGIQRIMVKSMNAALSVPALGLSEEIYMDNLIKLRGRLKHEGEKHKVKITFLPILIKAVCQGLKHYPLLNSHVNEDCSEVTIKSAINIGLAMDTARGLLVPNIKNVEDKSILEIAAELNRLQALGSEGKLGQQDLTGGTFTLSNIGKAV